jgi:hypothetical protein
MKNSSSNEPEVPGDDSARVPKIKIVGMGSVTAFNSRITLDNNLYMS